MMPVKGGRSAKSRLVLSGQVDHAALARALALDALEAVLAAGVADVLVVTGDAQVAAAARRRGALVRPDPGAGLNAAVAAGLASATKARPECAVAVLLGDLPSLRRRDVSCALKACEAYPCSFVPDRQGHGTVLLAAAPGIPLRPSFGAGSARRHAAFATRLELDLPRLRTDVDNADDLAAAAVLGLGARTCALLKPANTRGQRATGQLEAS